ncbi:NAD(P)-binding protein [Ophiobolus disseminans]|uniref:Short-chain dehydrogenase/reductase 3 n=1 Tax=Ophiobolus disseminans TaxID=1469910 RepID=A0A6A6ZPL7_9PLEO|nr:NAD(P)-binding protein [Ophiobolus disseminans]
MPVRSSWTLAREGITADTLARLFTYTALNPALTLPLILLARYTAQGGVLAQQHGGAFSKLKVLAGLGLLRSLSAWLDKVVTNNWSSDSYVWSQEVVVVTGGSDGIGKIVVQLLAERSIKVAVLDVQGLTYEAPSSVRYFHCDLSSPDSIRAAASAVRSTLGNPTVLVNNAGVARGKTILESTERDINLTFKVNAFAHYYLAQQFLPHMIATNHGMLITVASLAAYIGAPSLVDYAASKTAALAFHEGLSSELLTVYKAPKVRTVLMCQGYTRTALFEGFDSKALFPETVADEIVKAILQGKSKHVILPETAWHIAPRIRSWPLWMQYGLRKKMNPMKEWKGRQVVQPSEAETEKSGRSDSDKSGEGLFGHGQSEVGDSTVLVGA